jgi:DNA repair protein RadB
MVKMSAGSYDLNKWLYGGYENDIVTVIYGGPGSGKTNLCLLAAVSQAKKGNKIMFIDTEGGFSVERVKQLAGGKEAVNVDEVLKNLFILKPTNFIEQKKAFADLEKNLKKEVSLIIVDSMTMLYRIDFADAREKNEKENKEVSENKLSGFTANLDIQKINSDLARQIKLLAEIARKKEIPVLVTSQVYRWEDANKMVGGDILRYWGKCLIEVENNNGRRTIYLRKHRSLPEKEMQFQIYDGGIRKKGWI